MKLKLSLLLTMIFAVSTAQAEWIDFTGWDHAQVTGGGQTFTDVCGDVDLLVTGAGSYPTSFNGLEDVFIGGDTDLLSLTFTFSAPVNAMMDIHTLDPDEILTITGGNPAVYSHVFGALPTQSGNLTLTGNAYGISANGASHGEISLGQLTSFTFTYEALKDNKFDRFSVGCMEAVPEPSAICLALIGAISLLLVRRK